MLATEAFGEASRNPHRLFGHSHRSNRRSFLPHQMRSLRNGCRWFCDRFTGHPVQLLQGLWGMKPGCPSNCVQFILTRYVDMFQIVVCWSIQEFLLCLKVEAIKSIETKYLGCPLYKCELCHSSWLGCCPPGSNQNLCGCTRCTQWKHLSIS